MTIDWSHFTPWTSLAGGILLGLTAALFILVNGRVLGISAILGGLIRPRTGDVGWRAAFITGLLVAPTVWHQFVPPAPFRMQVGGAVLVAAGLLVGWGTRQASGCTSGHGVCGLSRLSLRSLAATVTFMAAGFATVFLVRHVLA